MDDCYCKRSKKHHKSSEHREFTGGYSQRRVRAIEAIYEKEASSLQDKKTNKKK